MNPTYHCKLHQSETFELNKYDLFQHEFFFGELSYLIFVMEEVENGRTASIIAIKTPYVRMEQKS
jgi:hypothetical protein